MLHADKVIAFSKKAVKSAKEQLPRYLKSAQQLWKFKQVWSNSRLLGDVEHILEGLPLFSSSRREFVALRQKAAFKRSELTMSQALNDLGHKQKREPRS